MHVIWKQEGMKEVREQQLCDQRRQIEEKHWLKELEIETIKQKIEGQSTKDAEVAPVVRIVTEEEYIELFGTENGDETFDEDWSEIGLESTERGDTRDTECQREELQERNLTEKQQAIIFRIKEVQNQRIKSHTRKEG